MATKPNITLMRWADTIAANVVNPPSGSRDTGHVAGDPADEGFMNALQLQAYRWAQYLDDGDLDGDVVIDGNLEITGDLQIDGTLGDYGHSDRELPLSAAAWSSTVGTKSTGPVRITSTAAGDFFMAIPMLVRDRIKSVTVAVFGNGGADISALSVIKTTAAGIDSILATTAVNDPAASWQPIALDPTDTELATGDTITVVATVNAAGIALGNVSVIKDRLPPP